jgi:hypothetical protein
VEQRNSWSGEEEAKNWPGKSCGGAAQTIRSEGTRLCVRPESKWVTLLVLVRHTAAMVSRDRSSGGHDHDAAASSSSTAWFRLWIT